MSDLAKSRGCGALTNLGEDLAKRLVVCLPAIFLLLGVLFASGTALGAPQPDVRQPSSLHDGSRLSFAVADFDGDDRPDLVTIQPGQPESAQAGYWIRVRLSASGAHFLRVIAPRGGLLVEARDVNGDHAVDLVFATAWLGRQVAVLLNDGHGNFSQASPSAFPGAFTDPQSRWSGSAEQVSDALAMGQESPRGLFRLEFGPVNLLQRVDSPRFSGSEVLPNSPLTLRTGRAPPSANPL